MGYTINFKKYTIISNDWRYDSAERLFCAWGAVGDVSFLLAPFGFFSPAHWRTDLCGAFSDGVPCSLWVIHALHPVLHWV